MELADEFVYRRGKGIIVILIHLKLLYRLNTPKKERSRVWKIFVLRWVNVTIFMWFSSRSLNVAGVTPALQLSMSNTASALE
jgi:hypothetical protein